MSAGLDYLAGMSRPTPWRELTRMRPDLCADYEHPGVTYNPWQGRTWCLCGQVIRDGKQLTRDDRWTHKADCCGGPLVERIER